MKHDDFIAALSHVFAQCILIAKQKSTDYSGTDDNFHSFKVAEMVSGVSVADQLKYEIGKKLSRINRLSKNTNQVPGEGLVDSIDDAINYLAILRLWVAPVVIDEVPEILEPIQE